jgi:glutamine cyclotransferase
MNRRLKIWVPVLLAALGAICVAFYLDSRARARDAVPVYSYRIVNTYPHDRNAFTQGLVFADGFLYEGTGLRGRSALRKVKLETGEVLQRRNLGYEFFGEGVTIYGDKIIQLTLRANVGFVYDKETFKLLREFNYSNEGWGITHNGKRLIMSDGTSRLHFLNPETFEQIGRIKVRDSNGAVTGLNELEYVKGQVYANIWGKDRIAQINPQSGKVTGWIELAGLLSPKEGGQLVDVLNGIAYDAENDRLFVTGKWWPKLFEIRVTVPE